MDPYVLIQYKSPKNARVASPETVRVEYPAAGNGHDKLTLKIMDKDTFTYDDLIGHATILIGDLMALGAENGTAEMHHPAKYRVVRMDGSYNGKLQVGIKFNRKEEDPTLDGEGYGG